MIIYTCSNVWGSNHCAYDSSGFEELRSHKRAENIKRVSGSLPASERINGMFSTNHSKMCVSANKIICENILFSFISD